MSLGSVPSVGNSTKVGPRRAEARFCGADISLVPLHLLPKSPASLAFQTVTCTPQGLRTPAWDGACSHCQGGGGVQFILCPQETRRISQRVSPTPHWVLVDTHSPLGFHSLCLVPLFFQQLPCWAGA